MNIYLKRIQYNAVKTVEDALQERRMIKTESVHLSMEIYYYYLLFINIME